MEWGKNTYEEKRSKWFHLSWAQFTCNSMLLINEDVFHYVDFIGYHFIFSKQKRRPLLASTQNTNKQASKQTKNYTHSQSKHAESWDKLLVDIKYGNAKTEFFSPYFPALYVLLFWCTEMQIYTCICAFYFFTFWSFLFILSMCVSVFHFISFALFCFRDRFLLWIYKFIMFLHSVCPSFSISFANEWTLFHHASVWYALWNDHLNSLELLIFIFGIQLEFFFFFFYLLIFNSLIFLKLNGIYQFMLNFCCAHFLCQKMKFINW